MEMEGKVRAKSRRYSMLASQMGEAVKQATHGPFASGKGSLESLMVEKESLV